MRIVQAGADDGALGVVDDQTLRHRQGLRLTEEWRPPLDYTQLIAHSRATEATMVDLGWFKEFLNPFGWFLSLGKADAQHVKDEIQDLLQHSSQSLRSLIELSETLEEIPLDQFTEERFWPIANHCYWFFTSPDAAHRARTHCTDIQRDVARIEFKMTKLLRTEDRNWKGIDDAFRTLMDADHSFLKQYEAELARIGAELDAIGRLLGEGGRQQAWDKYNDLRASLTSSRQAFSKEIARMQAAQTHVHRLLT
ncbi:MAG: hypothetical protein ACOZCP_02510 [Pseudomonadota bacterium]